MSQPLLMEPPESAVAYFGYTGPISSDGATRIASALNIAVNNKFGSVYIAVNSLGGNVADGVFLHNYIRALPIPVTFHNIGTVASIAVAVFVAAKHRYSSRFGTFMIHPTTFTMPTPAPWEVLDALRQAALLEDERTEHILRERTRVPDEHLSARRVRDVHISAEEAKTWGIVDAVKEFSLPSGVTPVQI